jgi:hypothetical protein
MLDLNSLLQESSQCQVQELARPCFQTNTVDMKSYLDKFCSSDGDGEEEENFPACVLIDQVIASG